VAKQAGTAAPASTTGRYCHCRNERSTTWRTLADTDDSTVTEVTFPCRSMHSLAVIVGGSGSPDGKRIGCGFPLSR
jgi:hypothetical protein